MENKRTDLRKNQRGSALPFVIIIGLVLLVLVASLATVATGGINFTQKSVESRQAYVDAKTVTEYGQVLIDEKIAAMKAENPALANKSAANEIGEPIFYIKGERSNPLDPLTLSKGVATDSSIIGVGKLSWKPTVVTGDAKNRMATTTYTISVETQNLARKLDYKTTFDYTITPTTTTSTGTYPIPPSPPAKPTVVPSAFGTQTAIKINGQLLECQVPGYGIGIAKEIGGVLTVVPNSQYSSCNINLTGFAFKNDKTLVMAANQIAVSTAMPSVSKPIYNFGDRSQTQLLYFANGYKPNNDDHSTNILKAKNIVIIGDLTLTSGSKLDIDCDNLWITGKLSLTTNDNTIIHKIKATNVIINGDLYLGDKTLLTIDCPNVWLDGKLTSGSSTPELTLNNVQYFKAGTMNLNDKMKLNIVGDPNCNTNQVEVGSLDTTSTGQQINITGMYLFNCLGNITQNWSDATLNIQAKVVTIGGNLSLTGIKADNFKIFTQYFICRGNTLLQQIDGTFYIGDAASQTSCIKFEGDYSQIDSIVHLYGTKNIVFNNDFELGNWGNREIVLASDNIYFRSNTINTNSNLVICRGVTSPSLANVLLKTQTSNPKVVKGKYIGYTTTALDNPTLKPGTFEEIPFPDQPFPGETTVTTPKTSIENEQSRYY